MSFIEEAKLTSVRAHGEIIARLIIDTVKRNMLFVPASINHPEFLADYLNKKNKSQLKQEPDSVSPYVGAMVRIVNDMAQEIVIGISGIETVFAKYKSPLHTKEQVNTAKTILIDILQREGILAPNFKMKLMYL